MEATQVIKTSQEQAIASWIHQLNQIRLDELVRKLFAQDINLKEALQELQKLKDFIGDPSKILGSPLTKHGEIAEHFQVNISNARRLILGLFPEYTFEGVGRTAPEDYLFQGRPVQSKFYVGDLGNRSFDAVKEHLKTYPGFIKTDNGFYQIPKDQYEKIISILNKPSSALSRSENTLVKSIRQWERDEQISFTRVVKPSVANYQDVQQGKAVASIKGEEDNIRQIDQQRRNEAYEASKPTIKQGVQATAVSAAVEGGMSFCLGVAKKLKEGKKVSEFTAEDWKEVGLDTAKGTATGGIRGAAIYGMTNFTATPAAVASAFVTAVLGVSSQARQLQLGNISEEEFLDNSQVLCLDVSVSAVSSLLGQVFIPVPVLGAVIGNVVGTMLYGITKDYFSQREQALSQSYMQGIEQLNKELDEHYQMLIAQLKKEFAKFVSITELAFDEDVNLAFDGSVALADYIGVQSGKVLRNKADIDSFFLA
ncbi:hypothetical protein D1841_10595 [Neglecta sp. X4]|uniref:hypothetical protein n=1 Tax=unclassified Neglectibacter TaxID=2632164 RepID=UPI00136928B8|nr:MULTISPECIES: hypothetical protein [unclassified Neglectibacter]NBI18043.1 hypothetical protein [Neglectibacter sp. 59]NBJ73720.1 hypothetical protein [Neglectibacter sp. X4]NCE81653.1 hypothetical protein [Neglectibacter sp. X58]